MVKKVLQQGRSKQGSEAYSSVVRRGSERCENDAGDLFHHPHGCSSTQTSPSGVCSNFQMGVICFNSSIVHLQARNASARCSAPTTIKTMFSPMPISP